jgi:hypothetical protein
MTTRLSVNINAETADVLLRKRLRGESATAAVRRAISMLEFFDAEKRKGNIILIKSEDGTREVVWPK